MRARLREPGGIPERDPRHQERLANRRRSNLDGAIRSPVSLRAPADSQQRRFWTSTFWDNLRKAWRVRYPTAVISWRSKLLYYPVPKAASSSVKRLLARIEGKRYAGIPQHEIEFDCVWGGQAARFCDFTSFTVIRNPWDRFLSCYLDKIRSRSDDPACSGRPNIHEGFLRYNQILGRKLFHSEMSLHDFAEVVSWIPDSIADEHFRSQYRMFSAPDGTPLASRIIKFEQLPDGVTSLLREVGVDEIELEASNRTRHGNYREFYDRATRELVGRRYRRDIEQFGYAF